jgi:signal-transduction protein with cAMP-binding, CBS, and nucleotidyltransferase domain
MIAEELINHMVPPLKMTDTADKALAWMEELRCNNLPVVENGKFLGLISEDNILEENNIEKQISTFELSGLECVVNKEQHFYDAVKIASAYNVQIIAVVDDENVYMGVITIQDTITSFAQTAAVQAPGAILVLSMEARDYSLSEISRLIEGENAKILGSTIREDSLDPMRIKLTLKINKTDLSHVVATLERFDYRIIARFQEPKMVDNSQERLDILMKYLDI